MTVYTDKDAKRDLDALLDDARSHGEVRIKRDDGEEFALRVVGARLRKNDQAQSGGRMRDLSDLAGSWVEDPAFDQAIEDQD